jgi:ribosomal protein S1
LSCGIHRCTRKRSFTSKSELAWERTENVTDVVNMGDAFIEILLVDPKQERKKFQEKPFT